tara:strand:- start:626 stop:976 length:351 start_codon:yes stop_codon:yes gene_type:complete
MWQKKRNENKGKSYNYSTINKLKKEKKIDEVFLSRMSSLTLEEVIAIKLESAARYINRKLYNFPIWKSLHNVCREAVLKFALSSTRSMSDAASLLGISVLELKKNIKIYGIELDKE